MWRLSAGILFRSGLGSLVSPCLARDVLYASEDALRMSNNGGIDKQFLEHKQKKFAELSRDAMLMRARGLSDEPVLVKARELHSSLKEK